MHLIKIAVAITHGLLLTCSFCDLKETEFSGMPQISRFLVRSIHCDKMGDVLRLP
jgi:hypothetical protein